MDQAIKVAFLGVAGESGRLILNGLLESTSPRYVRNFPNLHLFF